MASMPDIAFPEVQPSRQPSLTDRDRLTPGTALLAHERYEEAIPFLEKELSDANHPEMVMSNLGICYRAMQRYQDSNTALAKALMIDPTNGAIWSNLAITATDMGEHEAALMASNNAICLAPKNRKVQFAHATILVRHGYWTKAWPLWEESRNCFLTDDSRNQVGLRRWTGEPFAPGSRFLVTSEWGYGDAFMMLRYLGSLKQLGAHVTFLCWDRQQSLLDGHPWIDQLVPWVRSTKEMKQLESKDYDYIVPIMSLPGAFRNSPSNVPYKEAHLFREFPRTLPPTRRRRIGIAWMGEEQSNVYRIRSYEPQDIDILQSVDAEWYSLLIDQDLPWAIPHRASNGWLDTAALISQLDLVVTVDTAVAHLAGLMGKPTWLLLNAGSCWRWLLDRPTSVWYDSMRLFRSDAPSDFRLLPSIVARELR